MPWGNIALRLLWISSRMSTLPAAESLTGKTVLLKSFDISNAPAGKKGMSAGSMPSPSKLESDNLRNWQKLYKGLEEFDPKPTEEAETGEESVTIESKWSSEGNEETPSGEVFKQDQKKPYQVQAAYIISQIKSGFILIDQQAAHERILYERYLAAINENETLTQKQLFSKKITLSPSDSALLKSMLTEIKQTGLRYQGFWLGYLCRSWLAGNN